MLGVKMLHKDEGHARVSGKVVHQFRDSFNAAGGSSDGYNGGVILVVSRHQAVRLRELLPSFFMHRFRAHKLPSVFGAEHAGMRENDGVMQIQEGTISR
jgi:hypothetical protein